MTSITLNVTGAKVQAAVNGPLTSGMVGIPVTIRYDDAWNGLTKNLVCRCGKWGPDRGETRTVLNIDEAAAVAHEVMQANMHLYLGIEGYRTDGTLVIPTTWADCGWIQPGANAGADLATDPKLSVWAQLQAQIEQIKQESITAEEIAAAVAAYLEENPIQGSDFSQNVVIDTTLTVEGAAADAKAVGDALAEEAQIRLGIDDALMALKYSAVKSVNGTTPDEDGNVEIIISDSGQNATLNTAQINALDGMFKVCAFIKDDVSAEYAAFKAAFGIEESGDPHTHSYTSSVTTAATCTNAGVRTYTCSCGESYTEEIPAAGHNYVDGVCTVCGAVDPNYNPDEPEVTLTSISAAYSGGDVAVGTTVTDLTGIVVTGTYSDGSTKAVDGYTLSGEIAEGENTITVSYGGKTTTFTVTGIVESSELPQYDFTVVGNFGLNADGTNYPSAQYNCTDFIDIDSNYSTLSVATYLDAVSDTRISSGSYVQWFNGDTFLSRTGGSPVIEIGNTKCTKPIVHTAPEGATKFRVCVQNNCDRFVLYKGTVSASDI